MVTVEIIDANVLFKINGLHKLWAFKSSITVPLNHIQRVYQDREELNQFKGIRAPGTHIPFLITAGTYHNSGKFFWDVMNKNNAIIVNLVNESYDKLIIEVENPIEIINQINKQICLV